MNLPLIHPNLYLGDLEDAKRWPGATVCVAGKATIREGVPTYSVVLDDTLDIDPIRFLRSMEMAAFYIHEALMMYPKVLVHCFAGINRSVSALVAYTTIYGPSRCLVRAVGCLRKPRDTIKYIRAMNRRFRDVDTLTNTTFASLLTGQA